jgi:hypothetical protein
MPAGSASARIRRIIVRLRRRSRSPAEWSYATAAHSAWQAGWRPLPILAGQRSADLHPARHAPFSDNVQKWVVAAFTIGCHPPPTSNIIGSGLRCAPLGGGCAAQQGLGHGGDGRSLCLSCPGRRRRGGLPLFKEGLPLFLKRLTKSCEGRFHAFVGVGVGVGSCRQKCHHITPPTQGPPPCRFASLPPRLWAPRRAGGPARPCSPPHRREKLTSAGSKNSRPAGRFFGRQGQIVTKRFGNFFVTGGEKGGETFGICHLFVTGAYFRPFFRAFWARLTLYSSRKCAPRGSNPEPID